MRNTVFFLIYCFEYSAFFCFFFFFFQAEDGIRDRSPSRGLGDVYKETADEVNKLSGTPSAKKIHISHSDSYRSELVYGSLSKTYSLSMYDPSKKAYGSTIDELTGKQLTFDNVVVCFANIAAYAGDSHDVQEVQYVQGGQAYLFTHGGVQTGRWEKPHPTHPLKLYTDSGEEMTLNRGKTYLALVDDDEWSSFNYQ